MTLHVSSFCWSCYNSSTFALFKTKDGIFWLKLAKSRCKPCFATAFTTRSTLPTNSGPYLENRPSKQRNVKDCECHCHAECRIMPVITFPELSLEIFPWNVQITWDAGMASASSITSARTFFVSIAPDTVSPKKQKRPRKMFIAMYHMSNCCTIRNIGLGRFDSTSEITNLLSFSLEFTPTPSLVEVNGSSMNELCTTARRCDHNGGAQSHQLFLWIAWRPSID